MTHQVVEQHLRGGYVSRQHRSLVRCYWLVPCLNTLLSTCDGSLVCVPVSFVLTSNLAALAPPAVGLSEHCQMAQPKQLLTYGAGYVGPAAAAALSCTAGITALVLYGAKHVSSHAFPSRFGSWCLCGSSSSSFCTGPGCYKHRPVVGAMVCVRSACGCACVAAEQLLLSCRQHVVGVGIPALLCERLRP